MKKNNKTNADKIKEINKNDNINETNNNNNDNDNIIEITEDHIVDKIKKSFNSKLLLINNTNLYDMYLMTEKKNYRILFLGQKLRINSLKIKFPFGVEKYNNKEVLNMELINYNKTNGNYNFYSSIKQIDYVIKNIISTEMQNNLKNPLPFGFHKEIAGKHYMSCIKEFGNFNPLLRTHIKKTIVKQNTDSITRYELKGKFARVELECGALWVNQTNYGIIWYVTTINVY